MSQAASSSLQHHQTALLQVQGLSRAFGGVQAVSNVSFDVHAGQMLALIGPNGAGKSTCFNLINGQLKPDHGRVLLHGRRVDGLAPRRIWRHGVGRTFQIPALFLSMTVCENVQLALASWHGRNWRLWRPLRSQFKDEALTLLSRVDMAAQANRPCTELAYGDIKRVELAVALAGEPRLLLMDEPTAGMAREERHALMSLTRKLTRENQLGVLFTEHSLDVVFAHADQIVVLASGEVIARGQPHEVAESTEVQRVYLGGFRLEPQ